MFAYGVEGKYDRKLNTKLMFAHRVEGKYDREQVHREREIEKDQTTNR